MAFITGMTSSDTVDTAVALQIRDSLKLIIEACPDGYGVC